MDVDQAMLHGGQCEVVWRAVAIFIKVYVNDQAPPGTSNDDPGMAGPSQAKEGRPTRKKKTPDWLASGDWVQ
jgi:hypothetical protein